jgi:hypothetical protein
VDALPRVKLARGAVVTAVSLCGAALFFAFCAWKFGAWNFYEIRQTLGWGHRPDYLAAFDPAAYRLFVSCGIELELHLTRSIDVASSSFRAIC